MPTYQYCTPEWLDANATVYNSTPKFQQAFQKLTTVTCFRVKADPAWGIDHDFIFGAGVDKGKLTWMGFLNETQAKQKADYILAATPQEWKRVLRKETKFLTEFMLGKITLDHGSKVGVVSIAPYSGTLIDVLTALPLQFPDEMNPQELADYRTRLNIQYLKLCG